MARRGGQFSFILLSDILFSLPGTTRDVAQRSGICLYRAVNLMRQMHALKLVHKASFERHGPRHAPMAVWAPGEGVDAIPMTKAGVPRRPHPHAKAQRLSAQIIAFGSLMRALREPKTVAALVQETGIGLRAAGGFVKHLRETGRVRIASWERSRYMWAAEYMLGTGKSAERPAPMTKKELNARWNGARAHRARQRAVELAIVRPQTSMGASA